MDLAAWRASTAAWRASKAAEPCPSWCVLDHTQDDPTDDVFLHESERLTVKMPPKVNGDEIRFIFITDQSEAIQTPDAPPSTKVSFTIKAGAENILQDYADMTDKATIDQAIHELERAAQTLRTWRDRLPEHAPPE